MRPPSARLAATITARMIRSTRAPRSSDTMPPPATDRAGRRRRRPLMSPKVAAEMRNDAASIANAGAGPDSATTAPPTAGPISEPASCTAVR
jgi:hypothetical protein